MHPSLSLDATRSSTLGVLASSHIQTVKRAVFWQLGVDKVALGQKVSFREITAEALKFRLLAYHTQLLRSQSLLCPLCAPFRVLQ